MPRGANIAPFQCCAPVVAEATGILFVGAENGARIVGAASVNQTGVAANYICADATDLIIGVNSTLGAYTVTLPTALTGKLIIVKDVGGNALANNITVDTPGAETIDGAANQTIGANYGTLRIYCDGTNWFLI